MTIERVGNPTAAVVMLGCKLSQAEGESIADGLQAMGFELKPFGEQVDVAVVHTCTVTETAGAKSRKYLSRARRTATLVVAAGCHAILDGDELLVLGLADILINHEDEGQIPRLVAEKLQISSFNADLIPKDHIPNRSRTRAFLPIQTGCNRTCSYCRVRLARGPSVSLSVEKVNQLIQDKIIQGYREIVLAGVDLADWHDDKQDLADWLAELLNALPTEVRIRISSLEPDREILLKIAVLMRQYPQSLARHLHIPMQSGSNKILEAMGRSYNAGYYCDLVTKLKAEIPDLCLGADILVGFPGESDEDFQQSSRHLEELPLSYLHVFPFSPRPGTIAAVLTPRVPIREVQSRVAELRKLSNQKWEIFRQSRLGTTARILVEGKPDLASGAWGGRAGNYIMAWGEGLAGCQNRWVSLKLERLFGNGVWGIDIEEA